MVTTKHCCYGKCNSDSRYVRKKWMKGVFFIKFPMPGRHNLLKDKTARWAHACGRVGFTVDTITKDTYICSKHFVGEHGPTKIHPDPIPATATQEQANKLSKRRKAPKPRISLQKKNLQHEESDVAAATLLLDFSKSAAMQHDGDPIQSIETEDMETSSINATNEIIVEYGYPVFGEKSTQTDFNATSEIVSLRIQNKLLTNKAAIWQPQKSTKTRESFDISQMKGDDKHCKLYTGLTWDQIIALWNFLGPAKEKLQIWNTSVKKPNVSPSKRPGPNRKLSPMNQLFLTLIRLRVGLTHADLAYRFNISDTCVSRCVTTWIQFLYIEFGALQDEMFPPKELLKGDIPRCFKGYKNLRVIIDATEFGVQNPTNFAEHGNLYSQYKAKTTFKVLIGIAPRGSCVFVSEGFEGSISDRQLTIDSGFLDKINPGDLVMADRGFTIRSLLMARGASLNIPPFLGSRARFTPQEDLETRRIAKGRIHVERYIERLKKYRIFNRTIPLSLKPVFSQMIFVGCCLVNMQKPIVP